MYTMILKHLKELDTHKEIYYTLLKYKKQYDLTRNQVRYLLIELNMEV